MRDGARRTMAAVAGALLCAGVALIAAPAPASAAGRQPTPAARAAAQPGIGINLAGISDWTTEWPFVDVFRTARVWISQSTVKGAPWGSGPAVSADARGWVTRLAPDQVVDTAIFTNPAAWPTGKYVVTWEGDGDVSIWGGGTISNRTANRFEYVPSTKQGQFLRLTRTDPADHVRDIHIWMPGFEQTGATQVFHPAYLQSLAGMKTLRFMDWMRTNASPVTSYDQYPTLDQATQTTTGVAPELMIDLSNRVGADPWFTMPAKGDDALVRRFAETVRDGLAPGRKAYVEYSNELWNSAGAFTQTRWAREQGMALGLSGTDWIAGLRFQARRSAQIFAIWRDVFGAEADTRLVRVLGLQAANPGIADEVLDWSDTVTGGPVHAQADAIAIAPYFDCSDRWIPGDPKEYYPGSPAIAARVKAGGVNRLLDACQRSITGPVRTWISTYRALAESYGLSLVAYESGQHLAGILGAENDTKLTELFHQANRHPRMRDLYAQYLQQWRDLGGGDLSLFASTSAMSKWGAWGLREFQAQPLTAAPKALAATEQLRALGQLPHTTARPVVTTLSGKTGLAAGGLKLTVSGTGLAGASRVRFGDTAVPFVSATSGAVTRLTVTTPARPGGGAVPVTVTTPGGNSAPVTFTYLTPPALTSLDAATALTNGGTTITITGTALTNAKVLVGRVAARNVTLLSQTSARFVAPAQAAGTVDVSVTTPGGTSNVLRLTYVNPPKPVVTALSAESGPARSSTRIVITGKHLTGTTKITIGKKTASFTVLSDTQISATLPTQPAGTWVNLHVQTPGGTSDAHAGTDFQYR